MIKLVVNLVEVVNIETFFLYTTGQVSCSRFFQEISLLWSGAIRGPFHGPVALWCQKMFACAPGLVNLD